MIISDTHKYVYIGIPRTGSKSMNHWLCEFYDGRSHAGHHDYSVPEEAKDYLVFTIVRNPYDIRTSGHFAVYWDDQAPTENELAGCKTKQERLQKFVSLRQACVDEAAGTGTMTHTADRRRGHGTNRWAGESNGFGGGCTSI